MSAFSARLTNLIRGFTGISGDSIPRELDRLPAAAPVTMVRLQHGDLYSLRASAVRKQVGDTTMKMLAFNGSLPGPTLIVSQGSEIVVEVTNETNLDTTMHWHGLRLENHIDDMPHGEHEEAHPFEPGVHETIHPGDSASYRLAFPDPGLFWYHPHLREDYTQEHGLYGNVIVLPADPNYWPPANRELTLVFDDILVEHRTASPFNQNRPTRPDAGSIGNFMLVNGLTSVQLNASLGEVIRLYLTNAANVRTFNFRIPGARLKLVGSDNGRVEHEEFIETVQLAPSERAVVDVFFYQAGTHSIEHHAKDKVYKLGTVVVTDAPLVRSFDHEFHILRRSPEMQAEGARLAADFEREPDKVLLLAGEKGHSGRPTGEHQEADARWEDSLRLMNRFYNPEHMHWKLIDQATGAENQAIQWNFTAGDRVKVRIANQARSDPPMQHPIHFHGERFLVLSRNGARNQNLGWKDTVLVQSNETVDLLVDMSNPGTWTVHCHIAEHSGDGMMFKFLVSPKESSLTGSSGGEGPYHTSHQHQSLHQHRPD